MTKKKELWAERAKDLHYSVLATESLKYVLEEYEAHITPGEADELSTALSRACAIVDGALNRAEHKCGPLSDTSSTCDYCNPR